MRLLSRLRRTFGAAAAGLGLSAAAGEASAGSSETLHLAWRQVTMLEYAEAAATFARLERDPDRRVREAARLGAGVTLLNLPPTTSERVGEARRRFEELWEVAEDPGVRVAAGYHLARVCQLHQAVPDPARAQAVYAAVETAAPGSLYGQLALAQQGIWDLFSEKRPPAEVKRRVAHWTRRAEGISDRAIRRNFLLCLTAAEMLFDAYDPATLLPILQEIQGLGHVRDDLRQIVGRRLAFAAEAVGDRVTARVAWQGLVDRFPRDPNRQFYLDRLRQIDLGLPFSPPTP